MLNLESPVESLPRTAGPRIVSVGTANPPRRYSQEEIIEMFGETDRKIIGLFRASHIKSRHLYLPDPVNGRLPAESNAELRERHTQGMLELGPKAIRSSLDQLGLSVEDIDYLCCISSTGFLCPGITAHLTKKLGFRDDVHRADILGMGCNAGLNGLRPVAALAHSHPGKIGLMLCVEICSAAYVYNKTLVTAVVNSLFGDGVAAAVIRNDSRDTWKRGPVILDFESHIITDAIDAMRFDLEGTKPSFYLDRDIPYVLGNNVEKPINRLLGRHGLKRRHIKHWVVHSGGKKVIDAIKYNLGLTDHDVRHTLSILSHYGNLSSGAFLFSYQELCREGILREGDLCVAMTMGPGSSIETALLAWNNYH